MHEEIKKYALELGFNLIKIIPAEPLIDEKEHLESWIEEGFAADLQYMKNEPEKRLDPVKVLPGAKSVICLAMNYFQDYESENVVGKGLIARYAWGKDYHQVIEKKLKKIRQYIIENSELEKKDFKLYTDAGPFLERGYAAKAELGFIGKNTTLITKEFGSWVFLAEIITTLELSYDKPTQQYIGDCGTCTRCMDACPTKAIVAPYKIDARKCIAYQTIENKGKIPGEIKIGNRVFGCDICQEVCPHNCRAQKTNVDEFLDHRSGPTIDTSEIKNMTEEEFNEKFKASPIKRAGHKGIIRNMQNML